jgi:hypothetical protein
MKVLGNPGLIDALCKTLSQPGACLVLGPQGSGKTSICKHACELAGVKVRVVSSDISGVKGLHAVLDPHMNVVSISSFFCSKPEVIFLDDFDLYGTEKAVLQTLVAFIRNPRFKEAGLRMIVTAKSISETSLGSLKKNMCVFRVRNPPIKDVLKYVTQLYPLHDPVALAQLCDAANGNVGTVLSQAPYVVGCGKINARVADSTTSDIVAMMFRKDISADDIHAYDPRFLATIVLDNIPFSQNDLRKQAARAFSTLHSMERQNDHFWTETWVSTLFCLPLEKSNIAFSSEIKGSSILNRTARRVLAEKKLRGIDPRARHLYFEVLSEALLTRSKACPHGDNAALCKDYLQAVGGISRQFVNKLD